MKKRFSVFGAVLYVLAGLMFVYALWAFVDSYIYIADMMYEGQIMFEGNEFDIISFLVSNSVQFFVFAFLLAAAGILINQNTARIALPVEVPDNDIGGREAEGESNADAVLEKPEAANDTTRETE